jgi:hypothetical protein
LISPNGCSLDKNIIENFVYGKESAEAKISSLFRLPDSQTVTFDCALKLCAEHDECKPNCVLKLDNPVGEDPELVSKLLRSSLPDNEDVGGASGHMPISFSSRKQVASTEVHVVERRETPAPTIVPTECKYLWCFKIIG